jgi:outer membrane protein OmpA-like peptidoglycan-associated protein
MKRFLISLLLIPLFFASSASAGLFDKLNEIKQKAQEVKEGVEKVKEVGEVLKGAPSQPSGVVVIDDVSKPWFFKMEWFDAGGLSQIYYQVNDGKPVLLGQYQGSLGKLKAPPVKIPNLKKGDRVRFLVKTYWNGKWYGPVYSDNPKYFIVKKEGKAYAFQFEDAASADSAYNDGKFLFYQGEEGSNSGFGKAEKTPFVFEGDIYFIPEGTGHLPDFSRLKPVGKIYTPVLNVQPRDFREGFPGVTDRFEWFAIDYRGKIYLPKDRDFTFYLLSDDGARLIIDGKTVIDNDGIHPPVEKSGRVSLKKGFHTVEVQYFQGPRYEVALVLSYLKGGQKAPFDIRDFAPVKFEEGKCRVNLTVSSGVLFDFNSYALKPEAMKVLDEVASYIVNTPYQKVVVEGHTDDVGSEDYNLKLSKQRARSVASYLIAKGVAPDRIEVVGYGESKPKYPNTTEENRAKNRRVEIKLLKRCER